MGDAATLPPPDAAYCELADSRHSSSPALAMLVNDMMRRLAGGPPAVLGREAAREQSSVIE